MRPNQTYWTYCIQGEHNFGRNSEKSQLGKLDVNLYRDAGPGLGTFKKDFTRRGIN